VRATNKFFPDGERISSMFRTDIPIPFSDVYAGGIPAGELKNAINFSAFLNPVVNLKKKGQRVLPKLHPGGLRFAHIDLATSHDYCGIAVCHVGSLDEVRRRKESEETGLSMVKEIVPIIWTDLVLRVITSPGDELQIDDVRSLLYELSQRVGFRFASITFDSWQSVSTIQLMKKRFGEDVVGLLNSHSQKVGRGSHWYALKDAVNEHRIFTYPYAPLESEMLSLERNPNTNIVDHPPGGNNDTVEALAGAVLGVMQNFELGAVDPMQEGVSSRHESFEEKLAKESLTWLLSDKPIVKAKNDDDEWDIDKLRGSEFERGLFKEARGDAKTKRS
jgi:hypothetical protein